MNKGSKLLFALVVTITMNSAQRPEVSVETELSAVQKLFDTQSRVTTLPLLTGSWPLIGSSLTQTAASLSDLAFSKLFVRAF